MGGFFQDKVAIVTGAGSGIGAGLALELVARGTYVMLADLDESAVQAAAEALGERAEAARLDVTQADEVMALIDSVVAKHGRLDLLFNNAGIGLAGEVRDCQLDDWRRVIEVNTFGVINGVHAAYPIMVKQGYGHIINTGSGAGLMPRPGMAPYAASKHAVVGLSTSLRAEGASLGVKVSVVCPGYIKTAITQRTGYKGIDGKKLLSDVPIKPMSTGRCANVILRGVRWNRAIIPVTGITWIEWWLYRLSPGLMSWFARFRAKKFREHRQLPTSGSGD